ncbi:MAG: hypothetical protein AAGI25_13595 [Bacteroidota bacterium]
MKITKELLKRHSMGLCSAEENKAVEEWFAVQDDEKIDLKILDDEKFNPEEKIIWSQLSEAVPELTGYRGKTITLYRTIARYAAAACIIFLAFFGGRYSTGTAKASPAPDDLTADHLFIFGYKGAIGNLPGNNFKIEFDGSLRLYNNSMAIKKINIGDTSFMLLSKKDHYLTGDTQNPELIVQDRNQFSFEKPVLIESYFSIQRRYE